MNSGALPPSQSAYTVPTLPGSQTLYARIYTALNNNYNNYEDVTFSPLRAAANVRTSLPRARWTAGWRRSRLARAHRPARRLRSEPPRSRRRCLGHPERGRRAPRGDLPVGERGARQGKHPARGAPPPVGGAGLPGSANPALTSRPYRLMATYFVSRYSSIPSGPPSRPNPDCLMPPNGAAGLETMPWLSPTIPVSSRSHTRRARLRSLV